MSEKRHIEAAGRGAEYGRDFQKAVTKLKMPIHAVNKGVGQRLHICLIPLLYFRSMTITEAKEKLKAKKAELNAFRREYLKEIKRLEKYILDNGGTLDKIDNSKRDYQIYLDREAGKPVKELAATYKLSEDSIRRIHIYQGGQAYIRSKYES